MRISFFIAAICLLNGCGIPGWNIFDDDHSEKVVKGELTISTDETKFNHYPWVFVYFEEFQDDKSILISEPNDRNAFSSSCNAPEYLKKPFKGKKYSCSEIRASGRVYYYAKQGWFGGKTKEQSSDFEIELPEQGSGVSLVDDSVALEHFETSCMIDPKFHTLTLSIAKSVPRDFAKGQSMVLTVDLQEPLAGEEYDIDDKHESWVKVSTLTTKDLELQFPRTSLYAFDYSNKSLAQECTGTDCTTVPNESHCKITIAEFEPTKELVSGSLSCAKLPAENPSKKNIFGSTFNFQTDWTCDSFR